MARAKGTDTKPARRSAPALKAARGKSSRDDEAPYTVKAFVPREAIGYLVTRTKTALWEEADRVLAPLGITLSQWVIVANLANGSVNTPAEICKSISYDPGAMTRLLDRMEKKGFIRRVRHTTDRRSVTLELTDAGRDLYPVLVRRMVAAYNHVLTGFTAAEARQFESYLKRILTNLDVAAPVADSTSPKPKKRTP